jgi:hypothetical protein
MTRWLLKAIDVGASAVFMALCTKGICVQFYQDIKRQLRIGSSPSRTCSLIARCDQASCNLIGSINVASSASAFPKVVLVLATCSKS